MAGFQLGDLRGEMGPMLGHRIGVQARIARLDSGHRGFRDDCPQRFIVGIVHERSELFIDHPQFLTQRAEPGPELVESSFVETASHAQSVRTTHADGRGKLRG